MSENTTTELNPTALTSSLADMASQAEKVVQTLEAEREEVIARHKTEREEVEGRLSTARAQHKRLQAIVNPPAKTERKVNMEWEPSTGTGAYNCLLEAQKEGKVVSNSKTQQYVSKLTAVGFLEKIGHRQGFKLTQKGSDLLAKNGD